MEINCGIYSLEMSNLKIVKIKKTKQSLKNR